jgi:hypothetical protein
MTSSNHMTPDRSRLLALVDRAATLTDERLAKAPDHELFGSISRQLRAIRQDVLRDGAFDRALQQRINIGFYAAREFEQSDPEYADLLEQIEFLYRDEGRVAF